MLEEESKEFMKFPHRVGEYILTNKLGDGAQGNVYLAQKEYKLFAIKSIEIPKKLANPDKNTRKKIIRIVREIKILEEMNKQNNENVIKCVDVMQTASHYYIVMEYCNGGDLLSYLWPRIERISFDKIQRLFKQIINGYKAFHENKLIHRDFKPVNILLHYKTEENRKSDSPIAKIADYGFAREIPIEENSGEQKSKLKLSADRIMSILGTDTYLAPEIIQKLGYSYKVDTWSLGVILYEMLFKRPLFGNNKECIKGNFNIPKDMDLVSAESIDFLLRCLRFNSKERISWDDTLKHAFIKSDTNTEVDWENFLKVNKIIDNDPMYYNLNTYSPIDTNSLYKKPFIFPVGYKLELLPVISSSEIPIENEKPMSDNYSFNPFDSTSYI